VETAPWIEDLQNSSRMTLEYGRCRLDSRSKEGTRDSGHSPGCETMWSTLQYATRVSHTTRAIMARKSGLVGGPQMAADTGYL
jgi:hypothetical protein